MPAPATPPKENIDPRRDESALGGCDGDAGICSESGARACDQSIECSQSMQGAKDTERTGDGHLGCTDARAGREGNCSNVPHHIADAQGLGRGAGLLSDEKQRKMVSNSVRSGYF